MFDSAPRSESARAGRALRTALAAGLLAAGALTPSRALADVDQALHAFKAGKYAEASAMFQALVDESPGYAYGYYMLGNCLLKMHEPDEAESSFRIAVTRNRQRFEYHHGLANALMAQGLYSEAVQVLNAVEPLVAPRHRYAYHALRGFNYAALKLWEPAARDLEIAATLRRDKTVLDQLGRVELSLGRFDRAAIAFRLSAAHDPSDLPTQRLLAESLLRVAASTADPRAKHAFYVEGLRAAEAVVAAGAQVDGLDLLARASLGAGEYARATAAFRAVLDANPDHCLARLNLSTSEIAQRLFPEAEKTLQEAKRCPQRAGDAYLRLGFLYLNEGRDREAVTAFTRADDLSPSNDSRTGLAEARARLARRSGNPVPPGERRRVSRKSTS
jgi:tetratricopeptide (TPR) repeat protein